MNYQIQAVIAKAMFQLVEPPKPSPYNTDAQGNTAALTQPVAKEVQDAFFGHLDRSAAIKPNISLKDTQCSLYTGHPSFNCWLYPLA